MGNLWVWGGNLYEFARSGEDYLLDVLDTDEGARRLGELGIGCNRGIPRHVRHMWFDEKIDVFRRLFRKPPAGRSGKGACAM